MELVSLGLIAVTFAVTWGLLGLVERIVGLRVTPEQELRGLDLSQHGELAYKTPGR